MNASQNLSDTDRDRVSLESTCEPPFSWATENEEALIECGVEDKKAKV